MTESPFLIGRDPEASKHLQLTHKRISRRCASLIYADGLFHLEDLGQRHGVFVNGQQISSQPLRDGDVITFGGADSLQLVFRTGGAQESLPQIITRMEQASTLDPGARDLRQLSLLLDATALLQSHLPVEDVLAAMLDRVITITDAERGLLLELDARMALRPLVARQRGGRNLPWESLEPSWTAIAQALKQRRSVIEEDVGQATSELRESLSIVEQQLRTVIAIPLFSLVQLRATDATYVPAASHMLGVLYLDSRRPAAFSRLERQILESLALEVSSVLDNARLVAEERERRRLEQELAIARKIQQALLPRSFQHYPHFQVTGVNRPCQAVGGDYFDLMELSTDRTAFCIADVSGKGLGAALVMAMLQGTFSAMTLGQEPSSVFAHVNRFICTRSEVQRYATLFFGILDTAGGLEVINAGHLPALLAHAGQVELAFPAECMPLGLLPEAEFKALFHRLEPGDTVVLVTDGITETVNPEDEQFGFERLQEVVQQHAAATIEKLQAAILAAVEQFSRGTLQADDITLLILRYHGAAWRSPLEP